MIDIWQGLIYFSQSKVFVFGVFLSLFFRMRTEYGEILRNALLNKSSNHKVIQWYHIYGYFFLDDSSSMAVSKWIFQSGFTHIIYKILFVWGNGKNTISQTLILLISLIFSILWQSWSNLQTLFFKYFVWLYLS